MHVANSDLQISAGETGVQKIKVIALNIPTNKMIMEKSFSPEKSTEHLINFRSAVKVKLWCSTGKEQYEGHRENKPKPALGVMVVIPSAVGNW